MQRYSWPRIWFKIRFSSLDRKLSPSTWASDSGMNGLAKSKRLSAPMMSSMRQLIRSDVSNASR